MSYPLNSPKYRVIVRQNDHSQCHGGYSNAGQPKIYAKEPTGVVKRLNADLHRTYRETTVDSVKAQMGGMRKYYQKNISASDETWNEYVSLRVAEWAAAKYKSDQAGPWVSVTVTLTIG